jgi:hypothetical protein
MGVAYFGFALKCDHQRRALKMDHWLNVLPVGLIMLACLYSIVSEDWATSILSISVVYIAGFVILIQFWPFSFSLVKLVTGLMSLVVLGVSINTYHSFRLPTINGEKLFRLVALSLVLLILGFLAVRISSYLLLPLEIVIGALFAIGFGVIQLGISQEPYKVFMALLVIIFGFEMVYSANETSLLVSGLLAVINLGLAMTGGYLIMNAKQGGAE